MADYVSPVNQYLKSIDLQPYDRYLPNAFNDSLSVLEKVNKIIYQLNESNQLTNEVVEKWNTFVEWVNNEGINQPIDDKINKLLTDGTFEKLINTDILNEFKTEVSSNVSKELQGTVKKNDQVIYIKDFLTNAVDDTTAIINAHTTANEKNLPVIYEKREYTLKAGTSVNVKTSMDLNGATFKVKENSPHTRFFNVLTQHEWVDVPVNTVNALTFIQDSSFIEGLEKIIPQQKIVQITYYADDPLIEGTYKNVITETFFHSQNGKIVGNIMKSVDSIVSMSYKNVDSPISIRDGSFQLDGNNQVVESNLFYVTRDNTTFENIMIETEWVHGSVRKNIFLINYAFNVTFKNILAYNPEMTLIPYPSDNVSFQGYIYKLEFTTNTNFEHVITTTKHKNEFGTVERGTWGCLATRYAKEVHINDSRLSRLDTHFIGNGYYIQDSEVDWVQLIGTGKLSFHNTVFASSKQHKMIGFYGATEFASQWLGDIEIIDCTFNPIGDVNYNKQLWILDITNYNNPNKQKDYTPFNNLLIENLTIDLKDYKAKNELTIRLLNLPGTIVNQTAHFPKTIHIDNVRMKEGKSIIIPTIATFGVDTPITASTNSKITFKNIEFADGYLNAEAKLSLAYAILFYKLKTNGVGNKVKVKFSNCHIPCLLNGITKETNSEDIVFIEVENSEINSIILTYNAYNNDSPIRFKQSDILLKSLSNQYIVQQITQTSYQKVMFENCYLHPYQLNSDGSKSINTLFTGSGITSNRFKNCFTDDLLFESKDLDAYKQYEARLKGNEPYYGTTVQRPLRKYVAMKYFDTTLNKEIIWNGTNWVDAMGTTV